MARKQGAEVFMEGSVEDNQLGFEFDDAAIVAPKGKRVVAIILLLLATVVLGFVGREAFLRFKVKVEDEEYQLYSTGQYTYEGTDIGELHDTHIPSFFVDGAPDSVPPEIRDVPTLGRIFAELMGTRYTSDPVVRRADQEELVDEWNNTLWDAGVPFRIALPALDRNRGGNLFVLSYFVVADTQVMHGETEVPVFLSTRADDLNVVEGYTGSADRVNQEVQVVIDSVANLGADSIWPLLDGEDDAERPQLEAHFAPHVRDELFSFIDSADERMLSRTATHRREIVEVLDTVQERERCGTRLIIPSIPLRGLDTEILDRLEEELRNPNLVQCASLEESEFDTLMHYRRVMHRTPGARQAVHALTAFAARNAVVGQVRAAAVPDAESVCTGCSGLRARSTATALAMVAEIAYGPAPYTSLYRVCTWRDADHNVSRRAAHFIEARLLTDGCEGPLPDDLSRAAQELEARIAPGLPAIHVPDDFPSHLPSRYF